MAKIQIIDDEVLGWLMRVVFGFVKPAVDGNIHISFRHGNSMPDITRRLTFIRTDNLCGRGKLFSTKTTLTTVTISGLRRLAKNPNVEKFATYLENKYEQNKNLEAEDLKELEKYPEVQQSIFDSIVVSPEQLSRLKRFLRQYYNLYKNRRLEGQLRWELPAVLSEQILSRINHPNFIGRFGDRGPIFSTGITSFCHSLLYLHLDRKIKILDLKTWPIKQTDGTYQKGWEAILEGNTRDETTLPLPKDAEWIVSEDRFGLKFTDGKKLEFLNIEKPTAEYFKMLIENHGLPVKHTQVRSKIPNITNGQIRNLVKALKKKIGSAVLGRRIKIESDKHGAYTLIIT